MMNIACPFCDNRIRASAATLIKCANCGEAFEVDPDQEEEPYESGFF
jgi:DNA-directed RNA polymerase subunit RPC12/RpoP